MESDFHTSPMICGSESLLFCVRLQDTSGSRSKDGPAGPSPVLFTAAAPLSAHSERLSHLN